MRRYLSGRVAFIAFFFPAFAYADFQSSFIGLITAVVSGIFPSAVFYEAGKAGVLYARKHPEAKDKAEAVAIGAIAVLGINGVWSYIKGQIH
jgi:hypothetical protein